MLAANTKYSKSINKQRGFTLLELLASVLISTILVTIGVPNFLDSVRNNRLTTQTNDLVTTINLARSEALRRGVRVTVCKSSNLSSCNTTTAQWEDGWVAFVDSSDYGVINAGEDVLRKNTALPEGTTLRPISNFSDYFSYLPSGRVSGNGGKQDTFTMCDPRGISDAKSIAINSTGRNKITAGVTVCP